MKAIKIKTQNPIVYNILVQEIKKMPNFALQEILNYALFIKSRHISKNTIENNDFLQVAETSLAKDWLRPEEDEAWKDL